MSAHMDMGANVEHRQSSLAARKERQRQLLATAVARRRRARLVRWAGVAGVAAVVLVGGYWYFAASPASSRGPSAAGAADARITLVAGQAAPDFTLPTTSGQSVHLADYRGKQSVLLYFQEGVMCPPCWQQMLDLQANQAALDGLHVALLTLAVDPPQQLAEEAARQQVSGMPLLYDENARVSRQYQALYVSMHPGERPGHTFVLIDPDGVIRWRQDFQEMFVPSQRVLDAVKSALGGRA